MSTHKVLRLKAAYKHPWLVKKEKIFEFYTETLQSSVNSTPKMSRKVSDYNVKDNPNFNELYNIDVLGNQIKKSEYVGIELQEIGINDSEIANDNQQ